MQDNQSLEAWCVQTVTYIDGEHLSKAIYHRNLREAFNMVIPTIPEFCNKRCGIQMGQWLEQSDLTKGRATYGRRENRESSNEDYCMILFGTVEVL